MNQQVDAESSPTEVGPGAGSGRKELPRGTSLGRYVIIEPVGSGGMGAVYRAYDPELNRGVALKILSIKQVNSQAAEIAKARLIREAQALARLSHPNVVAVHDVGSFGEDVFIAMELVEGKTLNKWMKEEERTTKEILEVMKAAGRGLSAAHKVGLIHRDIKPGNIIVGDDGRVRVLDFGLARAVSQAEVDPTVTSAPLQTPELIQEPDNKIREPTDKIQKPTDKTKKSSEPKSLSSSSSSDLLHSNLTQDGGILGTPFYMAPEQLLGGKTDERTDVFGFCLVLYEALYGSRPFAAETLAELKDLVLRERLRIPSADKKVPDWLWQIIRKGLHVNPQSRYANLESLLEDLEKDPEELRRKKREERVRRMLVPLLIMLTITVPIGVWYGLRFRTVQLCKEAEGEFSGVWDDATKASVRGAFLGTNRTFALGTWERVEKIVDAYALEWIEMQSDVCEARLVRGTQSEELFDLRMVCLKNRKLELAALMKVFQKADAGVLQEAVQASKSLTSIAICADEQALRAPYPPPKTEEAKKLVAAIRAKLAEVEALIMTAKYQEGLELAKNLEEQAIEVDYQPVRADALYSLGVLFEKTGEYKMAETKLYDAARIAGESRDALLAAKALSFLVWVVGYQQARYEMGLTIGRDTEVMLGVANGDETVRSMLLNNLGAIFHGQGQNKKALELFSQSLAIREKVFGNEHPLVAQTLNSIGTDWQDFGDFEQAMEYYKKALSIREKVLGPKHPDVAQSMNNIGNMFSIQGEYSRALEYYQKALAIRVEALGAEHPLVASILTNIGMMHQTSGEYDLALERFQEALAIRRSTLPPEHQRVAMSLNNVGVVLHKQGKNAEAREYLQKADANLEKNLGPEHPALALTLEGLGMISLDEGRMKQAREYLERVQVICAEKPCEPDCHGEALFGLARVLAATSGDLNRAIALSRQARGVYAKIPKRFKKELQEIDAWLKERGVKGEPESLPK